MSDRKKVWRQRARIHLAKAFGGKCCICGYDKCISALDYHHIVSEEKDAAVSRGMKNGWAWSRIINEAKKCTIICCRCHRELHAGIVKLPKVYPIFNEEYNDIKNIIKKEYDKCPVCGTNKLKSLKYCSYNCANETRKKFEVSKEELEKLVYQMSFLAIGRKFNVSDCAVRKRCIKLGVKIPKFPFGYWNK